MATSCVRFTKKSIGADTTVLNSVQLRSGRKLFWKYSELLQPSLLAGEEVVSWDKRCFVSCLFISYFKVFGFYKVSPSTFFMSYFTTRAKFLLEYVIQFRKKSYLCTALRIVGNAEERPMNVKRRQRQRLGLDVKTSLQHFFWKNYRHLVNTIAIILDKFEHGEKRHGEKL